MTIKPGFTRARIKYLLEESGVTLAGLSLANGYSRNACSQAIRSPWPAVERIIADALKVKPCEVWPDRYDQNGNPITSPLCGRRQVA
ncbi:MAG: helix-turn-helix domain-containing protein [Magnetococcales bacterium]|nr:helix-turn-helix domain-containing protein [Magnetococcales bacterium]